MKITDESSDGARFMSNTRIDRILLRPRRTRATVSGWHSGMTRSDDEEIVLNMIADRNNNCHGYNERMVDLVFKRTREVYAGTM